MPIQQGDEVQVDFTFEGKTMITPLKGHVASNSGGEIGIALPGGQGEWKVPKSSLKSNGDGQWRLIAQLSFPPA